MGSRPAAGDGVGGPVGDAGRIGADDEVEVVAHHRIGEDVDGEGFGGGSDGLARLVAAVLGVIAAEKSTADAAGDAVEAGGGAVVDEVFAGYGHGGEDRVVIDSYQWRRSLRRCWTKTALGSLFWLCKVHVHASHMHSMHSIDRHPSPVHATTTTPIMGRTQESP